ncbi:MAG: acyltransferase [Roseateles depolymerans]|uniref:Acyltransferase n=1 Tax=Roseateles depolymerans TaxID=76731 RepID=A0A2W5D637_9BURK|nr:MAG: acyltransferase [Roseateles depolymerans]
MALWPYRFEAALARLRAWSWRLRGLDAGRAAAIHAGVQLRFGRGAARLGARSVLYRGVRLLATAGGRFSIGHDSHLAPDAYALIAGQSLTIGNDAAIGPGLMVFCESNDTGADSLFRLQYRRGPVSIGHNVFIGARVTLLPGAVIEDHVVVAAHSVVAGRLASGWLYGGAPARPLKPIGPGARA